MMRFRLDKKGVAVVCLWALALGAAAAPFIFWQSIGAGVLWGFRTEEELTAAGAEALAATPADLARYILGEAEGVHTPDREARAAACGGEG